MLMCCMFCISSRRRHTRWPRDWSSDVCSSDLVYNRLLAMGLYVTLPEGAFYIFPSIQNTGLSSVEFSLQLLKEENVAVIPGSAFSNDGEGFIRISYAQSMDKLEKGMDGLEKFINSFSN